MPHGLLPAARLEERTRCPGAGEVAHAQPCTPATPDQIFRSSQLVQTTGRNHTIACSDNDIDLTSHEWADTHNFTTGPNWSAHQLGSPTRAANIRVRRSNRGSTLLQSPARAGYATRMRQLFEEAGRDPSEPQRTSSTLYPQLANISRKASPSPATSPVRNQTHQRSTTDELPKYRLESLCLSTNLPSVVASTGEAHASLAHQFERSSGSWSDDSGYILTNNSQARGSSLDLPPNERIHAWLSRLPDQKGIEFEEEWHMESVSLEEDSNAIGAQHDQDEMPTFLSHRKRGDDVLFPGHRSPFSMVDESSTNVSRLDWQGLHTVLTMPERGSSRHTYDNCKHLDHIPPPTSHSRTSLQYDEYIPESRDRSSDPQIFEEDDMQLSPLSPNVCIERGPSRYNSRSKPRDLTTPCNDGPAIHFRAPRLKENVLLKNEGNSSGNGPFTPCNNRVNRRS